MSASAFDRAAALIADDLIAGRLISAEKRIDRLSDDERRDLEPVLARVWGVGRAPIPRGFAPDELPLGLVPDGQLDGILQYKAMMARSRLAWRVMRGGQHLGSAAVVNGAWFRPDLAGRALVLTCAHVCSTVAPGGGQAPAAPGACALAWECDDPTEPRAGPIAIEQVIWQSEIDDLDLALLAVGALPPWARPPDDAPTADPVGGDRVYVWGYRQGQPVSLSNEDNRVQSRVAPHFTYPLYTEPGVSGAPVFDKRKHELVGLHRAQGPDDVRQAVMVLPAFGRVRHAR